MESGNHQITLRVTHNDGATNTGQTTVTAIVPIEVDIKQEDSDNSITHNSQGVTPVAIPRNSDFNPYRVNTGIFDSARLMWLIMAVEQRPSNQTSKT